MIQVALDTEFIKLDQLLKFAEIVDSGGFAKLLIADGFVEVNGEACTMRGKKIRTGDLVTVHLPDDDGNIEESIQIEVVDKE